MENDISKNTIFVLVILTLLISILGTWTVLSQINAHPASTQATEHLASGQVSFALWHTAEPTATNATGRVAFGIKK
jgi:hypothetical protein